MDSTCPVSPGPCPVSPGPYNLYARRHTVNSHLLSVDDIFASSLPSPILNTDFSKFKERSHKSKSLDRSTDNNLIEDVGE